MRLPGGHLNRDGRLATRVDFRPLDGHAELAIGAAAASGVKAEAVSSALVASVSRIDGMTPDRATVDGLSVGDRNALMMHLGVSVGYRTAWITAPCVACAAPFDFEIDYAGMPMAAAPEGYPFADVALDGKAGPNAIRVRVPTGRDQLQVDQNDPRMLIEAVLVDGAPKGGLTESQYAAIDAVLSDLMPGPPLVAEAHCPACAALNRVPIDAAAWLADFDSRPLDDVHVIASVYHWSEEEILSLSRDRRRSYLQRIARDGASGP